ncbi:hypothetical protein T12_10675 [Trichinella patagoniensis]|uniref:DUF5641 domain-containing protein n=1 Tax=Trichinella patagoniensis TaxID=990121 RepID=A0A0V1AGP0_9BILA|nr:hypothetical protein T12_10675 [Trichinella patagoniensis]
MTECTLLEMLVHYMWKGTLLDSLGVAHTTLENHMQKPNICSDRIGDVADRVEVQQRLTSLVQWLLGAACQIDEERSEQGLGERITPHLGVAHSAVRTHPAYVSDPPAADETYVETMAGRVSGDCHLTREMYENQTAAGKGDIVFLVEESVLRNRWKLGMIIEPLTGSDGVTRTVKIANSSRASISLVMNRDTSVEVIRPVAELLMLESVSVNLCDGDREIVPAYRIHLFVGEPVVKTKLSAWSSKWCGELK